MLQRLCVVGWRPTVLRAVPFITPRNPFTRAFTLTAARQADEADYDAARQWYKSVQGEPIREEIGEISYSRSSGPGGQNVNKVNSKTTLRLPLPLLLQNVPSALHDAIRSSRYVAQKSDSILIQSDESRKQSANKDNCYKKLNELILEAYNNVVPGETTPEMVEKVKRLEKRENERRLERKKVHSSKKAARRGDSN